MNESEKKQYVTYRLETAYKTLDAAKVLADSEFWNSSINRLYYAAFYAVNALLVWNNILTKSHSTTKSQFSLHFVKTGRFDKKHGRLLAELFDSRQKGDYENIFDYDAERVLPLFEPVKELIAAIEIELETKCKPD